MCLIGKAYYLKMTITIINTPRLDWYDFCKTHIVTSSFIVSSLDARFFTLKLVRHASLNTTMVYSNMSDIELENTVVLMSV